ncbi:MAG TPA: GNAT family N-acetyltransferase [Solirubrobacterales bacterium]|jgi:GNAT superfamily N-acetyltransferase
MAEAAAGEAEVARRAAASGLHIREASSGDVAPIAAAVSELLVELSGGGPPPAELEDATRELAGNREAGALLVAEAGGEDGIVGVLAASWQHAIHVPGRYGTIQDLWVRPDWRSRAVGRKLLAAFFELAREEGARRVEVGLPRESFEKIAATEAFYLANGFKQLGPRMRRKL